MKNEENSIILDRTDLIRLSCGQKLKIVLFGQIDLKSDFRGYFFEQKELINFIKRIKELQKVIKLQDFKTESGDIDIEAYQKAQIEAGERCYLCKTINHPAEGKKSLCTGCWSLQKLPMSLCHRKFIRCPFCKAFNDVYKLEYESFLVDDYHKTKCKFCGKEYQFETITEFIFKSPRVSE